MHSVLARCLAVHNALAECESFEEQAVNSNVALLSHNQCVTWSFYSLTDNATVNSFSLVKKMKSTAYDGYLHSNEVDKFVTTLLQIHLRICVPKIINIERGLTELLRK